MQEINSKEIGQILRELRGERSQSEVAKALHISKSALSSYEIGDRIPRDNIKIRISNFYNRPIQKIFFAKNTHET